MTRNVVYYGSEEPLPERTQLQAGPLRLSLVSGELRNICLGDREVLRRIYVTVRDRDWCTIPLRVLTSRQWIEADRFQIEVEMESKQGDIDFHWDGSILGSSDGSVRFSVNGLARTTFIKNRIGMCVLHPIRECAGLACRVEGADGVIRDSAFPERISPHQPFTDVRSISHQITPGVVAEVRFDGDTFETEDQRNWSDASYKTYCPPLVLPYPNEIRAGTAISQSVTLKIKADSGRYAPNRRTGPVEIVADRSTAVKVPKVGMGMSSTGLKLDDTAVQRIRALHLSHLRVDLWASDPNCETRLSKAVEQAELLACRLELAVFLSDQAEKELEWLKSVAERLRPPVLHWLIFHVSEKSTSPQWVSMARAKLLGYQPGARFGGGSNRHFAELNRSQSPTSDFDFVATPLNPQVHAYDLENLADNLEAQGAIVQSAGSRWRGLPLAITPITLRPRLNVGPSGLAPAREVKTLPLDVDVRQMSLFGAGWTAGSLKHLSESGAHSATYFETVGWRGIMEASAGSLPDQFRSIPGAVFPLYHVLADFGEFREGTVLPSRSSAPRQVESLILEQNGIQRILLSNLGWETQRVRFICADDGRKFRLKLLDESAAEWAMNSPESFRATPGRTVDVRGRWVEIEIPPFAVARLDQI